MFNQFKTKIIYVKIKVNQMSFNLVNTNEKILLNSKEDFGNHRLLISKFSVAENLMHEGFNTLGKTLFFAPHVIVHPLENIDDKLSEVETKVFEECALSAGAKSVIIHSGKILTDKEILEKYPSSQRRN
jgi:hypothetical protein